MNCTEKQAELLQFAIGDQTDFPKITHDPYVNYMVDCAVMGEAGEYDASLYSSEEELKGCCCVDCLNKEVVELSN